MNNKIEMLLSGYGGIEQIPLNTAQILIQKIELTRIQNIFAASTAILYGYPFDHGNIRSSPSNRRKNMPKYLDSIDRINQNLNIETLVLSGVNTEHRDEFGNYINQNPITEAEAARLYFEENSTDPTLDIFTYTPEAIDGRSKFVEQLYNSLLDLRELDETNIIVHVRIQDAIRARLVLRELKKSNKLPIEIKTRVVTHSWKLDKGDATGSLAFSIVKFFKIDLPTIRQLPNYKTT